MGKINIKTPHFIRGESIPNIPRIIDVLKKEGFIEISIMGDNWMIDIDKIKQSLKNGYYKGVSLKFLVQLKITIDDGLGTIDDEVIYPLKEEYRDCFKETILKISLIKLISWRTITEALSINKNLSSIDQSIILEIEGISELDNLWQSLLKHKDLIQKQDRIKSRIRMLENRQYRIHNNEERNIRINYEEENQELIAESSRILEEVENLRLVINKLMEKVNFRDLNNQINELFNQDVIEIGILADVFIPSFYQRINIIETSSLKKNELLDVLNRSKETKNKLANSFLNISIGLICGVLLINSISYFFNYENSLSINEFIKLFLGHGFHFFIIEAILISSAIISFFQFRMYSKIVEIYDTYIFIVNSDSSYKDDDHFHIDDMEGQKRLFEMRKENTQKIHTLPEKTYSLLCGGKISDDLPQVKILEDIVGLIKKIKD